MTAENDLRYVIECQKNVMEAQRQMISLQQQMLTAKPKISVPRKQEYIVRKSPSTFKNPFALPEDINAKWTLDAYMKAHKISQRKMSELTGISQPTISRYMKGENIPNVLHAKSIRDATKGLVDIDSWRLSDD
jgi:hypothetical protein